METSFWFVVSGWSTALNYMPMTSLQLLGWEQSSPCVVSVFFFFFFLLQKHTHSPIFLLQKWWVKVCITCCCPSFTGVLTGGGQQFFRDCFLTTFYTQICLTKRCTCNIRVQIFYFAISVLLSWQMQNSSKIKTCFKFLAIFRTTGDLILLSSSWIFSAVVVPQQEISWGNLAKIHQSYTHESLKSTELFVCSDVPSPFRPPNLDTLTMVWV